MAALRSLVDGLIDELAEIDSKQADRYIEQLSTFFNAWQRTNSNTAKRQLKDLMNTVESYLVRYS